MNLPSTAWLKGRFTDWQQHYKYATFRLINYWMGSLLLLLRLSSDRWDAPLWETGLEVTVVMGSYFSGFSSARISINQTSCQREPQTAGNHLRRATWAARQQHSVTCGSRRLESIIQSELRLYTHTERKQVSASVLAPLDAAVCFQTDPGFQQPLKKNPLKWKFLNLFFFLLYWWDFKLKSRKQQNKLVKWLFLFCFGDSSRTAASDAVFCLSNKNINKK